MQHLNNLKLILRCNFLFFFLFLFIIVYIFVFTVFIKYDSKYFGTESYIEGKILSFSLNGNKLKMNILGKEEIIGTYYINSLEEKENILNKIKIGNKIRLYGSLQEPLNNTIPNNFNYRRYLYNNKIFYLMDIDRYEIIKENNIVDKIKDFVYKRAYSLKNGDYLLVLVLGDKALISSDDYNMYQNNGTSHLLAISGSHITVLLVIFSKILKKVKDIPKLIVLSIILLFFGFITGFQSAVNRAIFFFIISSINKLGKFNFNNLQILFLVAFIMILLNPFVIFDLGFLYSFIICGGIIYYQDKIKGNYLQQLFKISLISFLFSLPITAYLNYEINIMSIFINMIFVPLISSIVFPLAIVTFLFPFLNPLFSLVLNITNFLNTLGKQISIFINIPKMSILIVIVLLLLIILMKNNKKYFLVFLAILIFVKCSCNLKNYYQIIYLDVGQGDSTLLISPFNNNVVMIDTGGKIKYAQDNWKKSNKTYNLSDNTIKYLKSQGITKIDHLILSHGDYDHMGEAINLVNNFKVEKVIFNCGEFNELENELIKILYKKKIPYYSCIKELNIDDNKLYFLNNRDYDNENDNSSVIYTELNNHKFLFMGDAGVAVEEDLLEKYNLQDIDVLKVGHHGSNTSSSKYFIDKINPKYSIISVGKNNWYGHPNKEVLDNLEKSKIYRTDEDGSIMFKIKNNKFKIETCGS